MLDRAERLVKNPRSESALANLAEVYRLLTAYGLADSVLLDLGEVLAFQAERELVWIITAKQRLLATQSLRAIQERLAEPQFQRVHRNAIVNVDHVRKMSALSSQRWLITLSNALQLVVSKRQAHNIRNILQW